MENILLFLWSISGQNPFPYTNKPPHDKTNKMAYAPSEDSDQPGHPPSLIRVFAIRMKKASVLSYQLSAQKRFLSDWADAQADLSLHWAHTHFVGFVTRRLNCSNSLQTADSLPKLNPVADRLQEYTPSVRTSYTIHIGSAPAPGRLFDTNEIVELAV